MDLKTQKDIQQKLALRIKQLPPIFDDFFQSNRSVLSLSTRFEYSKDFTLFVDYLKQHYPEKELTDSFFGHLEKQTYLNFLNHVYQHTRSFQTTASNDATQVFKNGYHGVSRKLYALNHFTRFLYERKILLTPISLLGINSIAETRKLPPRFVPAELLTDFQLIFIPEKGFSTAREASFEKKNRPRNVAILTLLFYCGLKVHEIVELKQKDLHFTEQFLTLHRKPNRLNSCPIPDIALAYLKEYLDSVSLKEPEAYVFRSSHEQQISPRTIRQILSKVHSYPELSPELCRKTFSYYVEEFFNDSDTAAYLSGTRYRLEKNQSTVFSKMKHFDYTLFTK